MCPWKSQFPSGMNSTGRGAEMIMLKRNVPKFSLEDVKFLKSCGISTERQDKKEEILLNNWKFELTWFQGGFTFQLCGDSKVGKLWTPCPVEMSIMGENYVITCKGENVFILPFDSCAMPKDKAELELRYSIIYGYIILGI